MAAGAWRRAPANQSSYKLNEHGPALNVFWSRSSGMGAGCGRAVAGSGQAPAGESKSCTKEKSNRRRRLTRSQLRRIRRVPTNEPEGCGLVAHPFGSMWMNCSHLPASARTRWVTERIASAQAMARRLASGIERRNDRIEWCLQSTLPGGSVNLMKTIGNGNFFTC